MKDLLLPMAVAIALTAAGGGASAAAKEPSRAAGCLAAPATPTSASPVPRTEIEEIAVEVEWLFRCLTARDWDEVAGTVEIPDGSVDPFAALRAMDETGLFTFSVTLESRMVRSTGPEGVMVDVSWRVSGQLRSERWTFRPRDGTADDGRWSLVAVEAGVPRFDGTVVGITGAVSPGSVTLSRAELINPGGIELRLEVAPDATLGDLLVMFPLDACARAGTSPLTAFEAVAGSAVTISIDDPPDGVYALALVPRPAPISREAVCAAPHAVLKVQS